MPEESYVPDSNKLVKMGFEVRFSDELESVMTKSKKNKKNLVGYKEAVKFLVQRYLKEAGAKNIKYLYLGEDYANPIGHVFNFEFPENGYKKLHSDFKKLEGSMSTFLGVVVVK